MNAGTAGWNSKPPLRSRFGPSQHGGVLSVKKAAPATVRTETAVDNSGSAVGWPAGHQFRSVNTFRHETNTGDSGTFASTLNASTRMKKTACLSARPLSARGNIAQ